MKSWIAAVLVLAGSAVCPGQKADPAVLGKWKGESLCTVKPSACHDEIVVYEITAPAEKKGRLVWKADKIVDGKQEWMGTLDCDYSSPTVTCNMGKGVWQFTIDGNNMTGTLKLSDGTLFRKVTAKRAM